MNNSVISLDRDSIINRAIHLGETIVANRPLSLATSITIGVLGALTGGYLLGCCAGGAAYLTSENTRLNRTLREVKQSERRLTNENISLNFAVSHGKVTVLSSPASPQSDSVLAVPFAPPPPYAPSAPPQQEQSVPPAPPIAPPLAPPIAPPPAPDSSSASPVSGAAPNLAEVIRQRKEQNQEKPAEGSKLTLMDELVARQKNRRAKSSAEIEQAVVNEKSKKPSGNLMGELAARIAQRNIALNKQ